MNYEQMRTLKRASKKADDLEGLIDNLFDMVSALEQRVAAIEECTMPPDFSGARKKTRRSRNAQ